VDGLIQVEVARRRVEARRGAALEHPAADEVEVEVLEASAPGVALGTLGSIEDREVDRPADRLLALVRVVGDEEDLAVARALVGPIVRRKKSLRPGNVVDNTRCRLFTPASPREQGGEERTSGETRHRPVSCPEIQARQEFFLASLYSSYLTVQAACQSRRCQP